MTSTSFPASASPSWRTFRAVWPLAALLALGGCDTAEERAQLHAQNAASMLEAGNVAGARIENNKALALRDNVAEYYNLRGMIELRSGAPDKAFVAFRQALDLDATNGAALAYVANIGVQIGALKDAEKAADSLLVTDPNSINAQQIKGMVALARGKTAEGLARADKVIELSPGNEAGILMRARALALGGEVDKALTEMQAALKVTGQTPGMMITLINLYRAKGDGRAMAPLFPTLIEATNGAPTFLIDQANLHYRLDDKPTARRALARLLAAGSVNLRDYEAVYRLWSEYDREPLDAALGKMVAQSKDPAVPVATIRNLLAMRALRPASTVMDALPTDRQQQLRGLQARLLELGGRGDAALEVANIVLGSDSENVDALLVRAGAYARAGKANLALNDAQRVVQNDPAGIDGYLLLASLNIGLGEKWRARQIFEDGLKRLPQNYDLLARYTQFLQTLNDRGRAVSVTTAFARQSPASQRAWRLMAEQCQRAGDSVCMRTADEGLAKAGRTYALDDPPGTPVNRSLFAKIS